MAFFDGDGFDELIEELKNQQELFGEAADDVLEAGAGVVTDGWKKAAKKHDLRDTGDMIDSIGPTSVSDAGGIKSVDVYPQGKDRKGVRNAEKAYINHYGSSSIKATHFVDDAIDESEAAAVEAMAEAWYRHLEE